jgi:hypothetical protein
MRVTAFRRRSSYLAAGLLRDAPLEELGCAVLLMVHDLVLVIAPGDTNSMMTHRPEDSNGRRERRRKGLCPSSAAGEHS